LFEVPKAYESVTVDDVRKLASTLLRASNRTVGVLMPGAAKGE
jgi:predicted Zn-dependent peptidase